MKDTFTRVARPEDLGLSSRALLQFFEEHRDMGLHSLALVRQGKAYALSMRPWREDLPHTLFSLSKSFCSMAAGIAADEGLIGYDESVADVLRDSLPGGYDPRLHDVKLRHLLSMSSGLDPMSDRRSLRARKDWARTVLGHRVLHEPGSRFHYNTLGTYLAGRMVAARTGLSLRDYLMPRLFEPLGIARPQWDCCPMGYNTAGFGLHLSCLDIARAAQLLLNRGVWQGRRLLSEEYLALATGKQVDNKGLREGEPPDWEQGYGFQFWRSRHGRYRGDGMYGQIMLIDDGNDLALCCTAGLWDMGKEMDALHRLADGLLDMPAADRKAQAALRRLEDTLSHPAPPDDGGPMSLEGSYLGRGGRRLRIERAASDQLRLFLSWPGRLWPADFTLGRGQPCRGEYSAQVYGEGMQRYEGRYGVKDGVLSAQVLMPEGPYTLRLSLHPRADGLRARFEGVGFDRGDFIYRKAGQGRPGAKRRPGSD